MSSSTNRLVGVAAILAGACLLLGGIVAGRAWADNPIEVDLAPEIAAVIAGVVAIGVLVWLRARRPDAFDELVTVLFAVWVLAVLAGLRWALFSIWSALPAETEAGATIAVHWVGTNKSWSGTEAVVEAALVLAAGGLGGAVHITRSFAARTGAATFRSRWAWWYVLTAAIAAVAGFVVTLGIQGGALDSGGPDGEPWDGQAPLAVFVAFVSGLFARAALERLERFLPRPERHTGQVTVSKIEPAEIPTSTTDQTFTLRGTGFRADTTVRVGDTKAKSVTVADGTLTAVFDGLPQGDLYVVVENEFTASDISVVTRS